MSDVDYRSAVVKTFRERAIRTAHIIDDAFPTYCDLASDEKAKENFAEWGLALQLYNLFREKHIPCDVENTITGITENVERIRKSDLIVLDYNLAPGDTRKSISLVRELARKKHFNTIVVYTGSENLDGVWLNFAVALRGGWKEGEYTEADELLANLSDGDTTLVEPSHALISAYTVGADIESSVPQEVRLYREVLKNAGVASAKHVAVIEARIRREVRSFLRDDQETKTADYRPVDGGCVTNRPRWLQSGNCFVAIVGKPKGSDTVSQTLFDALDSALCEWRPNLLQIIVSEIQNILELDAIATDELHLRDPLTQVSLCYFLLTALPPGGGGRTPDGLAGPVHTLLDKLIDTVRQKLITDEELKTLAGKLFNNEIDRLKVPTEFKDRATRSSALFRFAMEMIGSSEKQDADQAFLRLNSFLSTEPFRGELTTGTVFTDGDAHWICMTPACDMVDRQPNPEQEWRKKLHPTKPIVAVQLKPIPEPRKALKNAEQSRHVFIKTSEEILVFEVMPDNNGPSYEFIFIDDVSRLANTEGTARFEGARLVRSEEGEHVLRELKGHNFTVVGQIRANYASRFLQQTGAWLSRIGVDFVRWSN